MNEDATVECPWCNQNLAIPPGQFGQRVSCPFCSGKFLAEAPAGPGEGKPGAHPQSEGGRDGTENAASEAVGGVTILIAGVLLLLVAAALAYWSIYRPWARAYA